MKNISFFHCFQSFRDNFSIKENSFFIAIGNFSLKKIILAISVFITFESFSQNENFEFGGVTTEDLLMKSHPLDTSASAIFLFNLGEAVINRNSTIGTTIKHHLRIKLFKRSSFGDWGNMRFLVQKGGMHKLKGATYSLVDNKIQIDELPDASVFKTKYNKYMEEISVAFPNLTEGCIIELSYSENIIEAYLPNWTFQHTIPTIVSEYSLTSPTNSFTAHINGSIPITNHVSKYDGKFLKWQMKNIPAFKSEPLMPDKSIYLSSIQFVSRYKSWLEIADKYSISAQSAGILEYHGYLKRTVKELTDSLNNPKEKIKAISDYIKSNVNWNGVNDYYAEEPKEVLLKKEGTSADINLLFGSMLRKAGFETNLILLSTRDNGSIKEELPSFSNFNYVICEVTLDSANVVLLDATDKYLPFDVLPEKCLNYKGLFVGKGKYGWRSIQSIKRNKIGINANIIISDNGWSQGKVNVNITEYAAYNRKKELKEGKEFEVKREFIENMKWNASNIKINTADNPIEPITITYNIESEELGILSNDVIYVNPFMFLKEETNPFKEETRIFPIELKKLIDNTLVCNITIPENYSIEELPTSKILELRNNAAKCYFNINKTGNRILVTSRLQINKTLYQPDEYLDLKEFYARIVAKKNENIVLKKKKK